MSGISATVTFLTFYYMFTRRSLQYGDVNDVIEDAEDAWEGQ